MDERVAVVVVTYLVFSVMSLRSELKTFHPRDYDDRFERFAKRFTSFVLGPPIIAISLFSSTIEVLLRAVFGRKERY